VRLYTYGDVEGIPGGVLQQDARAVMPAGRVFTHGEGFGKGSYAAFSDLFRYKLLRDHGGLWSECDVVCLRPFDFTGQGAYAVASERVHPDAGAGERLSGCVLAAPAGSEAFHECHDACADADMNSIAWGDFGADLLTRILRSRGLERHALPVAAICPVDWWQAPRLVQADAPAHDGAYAIHFWNEVWRYHGLDKDASYAPTSAYEALKRRYGVRP
jgi:hypothetical protein